MERTAAVAVGIAAVLVMNTLPVLTGILSRALQFGPQQIAFFGSADVFGLAVGCLIAAPLMNRMTIRALAITGLVILAVADFGALGVQSASGLTALRVIGGLGGGLATGACTYVFGLANQERNIAAYTVGQAASTFISILIIPSLADSFGWRSPFIYLAMLAALPLCLVPSILDLRPRNRTVAVADARVAPNGHIRPRIWLGIAGATIFYMGTGAMWTFLGQIGLSSGLSPQVVDRALGICAAFGFVSSVLALILGPRITRRRILVPCIVLNILGTITAHSASGFIFAAAISTYYFSIPIIMACQFGAVATADESGLAAIYVSSATFTGFTIGPLLAAYLIERVGIPGLLGMNIFLVVLAMTSILNVISLLHGRIPARGT